MKRFFWFYRRFAGTIFFLWLFSQLAQKFVFAFALDLPLFSKIFLFFLLILVVWEIKMRWAVISQLIKNSFLKTRNEFMDRTRTTQKVIVSFSPRVLAGRIGTFLSLVLAGVVSFSRFFWIFIKILTAFIFQPAKIMVFVILGIFVYIFILDFSSGLVILFLTASWVYVIQQYRFNGKFSVAGSFIFLMICPLLLIFDEKLIAEKAAIWAYIFLSLGVIQIVWESRSVSD